LFSKIAGIDSFIGQSTMKIRYAIYL
jgi:hypothetical protein